MVRLTALAAKVFWATIFAMMTLAHNANAQVSISERTKYYSVSGGSGPQLAKSIIRNGPKPRGAGHAIATTRTSIKVRNMKFKKKGRRCVVDSVNVILGLKYTYPRWKIPRKASAKLKRNWKRFFAQIKKHEETHGRISREYAKELHKKLSRLSGRVSRNCTDFGRRSTRSLNRLRRGYLRRQAAFDRRESRAFARIRRLQRTLVSTR